MPTDFKMYFLFLSAVECWTGDGHHHASQLWPRLRVLPEPPHQWKAPDAAPVGYPSKDATVAQPAQENSGSDPWWLCRQDPGRQTGKVMPCPSPVPLSLGVPFPSTPLCRRPRCVSETFPLSQHWVWRPSSVSELSWTYRIRDEQVCSFHFTYLFTNALNIVRICPGLHFLRCSRRKIMGDFFSFTL